jgi:diacylglycerol kinase family enzyme
MRKNREEGFLLLKRESENKKTIGVICGGDGTVMWVVSEMAKYSINPMKVSLSIIPLGTGNDFSRNLGWGS